jgi:hypothetical protein
MTKKNGKLPNATTHAIFSQQVVVPGEDPEEFEALRADLVAEWSPTGPTEEEAVFSIAHAMWRKRRLQKFLEIRLSKNFLDPNHLSYDEFDALKAFLAVLRSGPVEAVEAVEERCLKPDMLKSLLRKFPPSAFPSTAEWARAFIADIEKKLLLEEQRRQDPAYERLGSMFLTAATYTDEFFAKELTLDERLDAMLDRAVKRLVQTKALKQALGQTGPARTPERCESGNGKSASSPRAGRDSAV